MPMPMIFGASISDGELPFRRDGQLSNTMKTGTLHGSNILKGNPQNEKDIRQALQTNHFVMIQGADGDLSWTGKIIEATIVFDTIFHKFEVINNFNNGIISRDNDFEFASSELVSITVVNPDDGFSTPYEFGILYIIE